MKELIINQIIIPVLGAVLTTFTGVATFYIKKFLDAHIGYIEAQKDALKERIGAEQYNKDVAVVKQAVFTVEQLAKEFDWKGEMKHSKVLSMIEGKTGLTDEEIYNIIKGTVLEVNKLK